MTSNQLDRTATAIRALAASRGFDLAKLVKKAIARQPRERVVPPKYRDPLDPTKEWSGRGKHPLWFRDALEAGKKPEDMLIPLSSSQDRA
jgi:DNA-binding protein H-NS